MPNFEKSTGYKMKGSQFYGHGNQSPTKHFVDDVPDHNDGHSDDLQTPEEHKHGKVATDTHFADGTKKSKRDKFSDAETKAEIEKAKSKTKETTPNKQIETITKKDIDRDLSKQVTDYKGEKELKKGKAKVDYMQHVSGLRTNPTGERIEKKRTDYLESLNK